jgi:hypothetical protein
MCIAVDTYYLKRSAFLAVFAIELFEDRVPNAAIGIDDERAAASISNDSAPRWTVQVCVTSGTC